MINAKDWLIASLFVFIAQYDFNLKRGINTSKD